jgi:preprotein translocase subunit SecA
MGIVMTALERWRGSPVITDLGSFIASLREINSHAGDLESSSDGHLRACADRMRASPCQEHRSLFFALAREASRRTLGLRPFDVQMLAALALDEGAIVDMQTGEGKTLAAVMPAAWNALAGQGVHVLTFNDYLARRDAEWMRPVYDMLGVSVASIHHGSTPAQRRRAYAADITYVTAKESGFDYLRDRLALHPADVVQRPLRFALVDEADSVLIDEARSPLVIAGTLGREAPTSVRLAAIAGILRAGIDFATDEYARNVELTDAGIERVEGLLGCGSLHEERNFTLLTELNCALHARVLLKRDVDYIVRDGRIEMVDELTGRVVRDRHWPDGLQAAVEAKEGLDLQPDGQVLGSITLQHFLRSYERLCGMTGTAADAADELSDTYGLRVRVIPTNRPCVRVDHPDLVFTHRSAKERALVEETRRSHATRRPVLIGTLTVEESERLAEKIRSIGISCEVLNARHDAEEARIIAGAGSLGAVTISTNMAGRGTDIRLGGADERDREAVVALGGLYVMGTNRHESRRVDLQLRGRAGRQGDPGETRFFVSLEDDLLVRYGVQQLIPARFMPSPSQDPIDNRVVRREIARAQRIVDGQNREIRHTLWRYAAIVEEQRKPVMTWRQEALGAAGGDARRPEQLRLLCGIDREWRRHLATCADIREGIHLVSLGGLDPLTRYTDEVLDAFDGFEERVDAAVAEADAMDLEGPSATWTYVVNDDPFRNQIAVRLMGPGRTTMTVWAAAFATPLLLLWAVVDRLTRQRRRG